MATPWTRSLSAFAISLTLPGLLSAQAAVDPSVAPRAGQMARAGERPQATEMLGRYLATAPDDGAAWQELGFFYILDSREWHRTHAGDPSGALFLDFAATALDQALRSPTDSARLLRAMVELDRAVTLIETTGEWVTGRRDFTLAEGVSAPAVVMEFGANLVHSCPVGGVLVTGSDLEAVAAWTVLLAGPDRADLALLLPARYDRDSLYRSAMARTLGVEPNTTARAALGQVAARRPVCLAPGLDTIMAPGVSLVAARLVRVAGHPADEDPSPLSVIELLRSLRAPVGAVDTEVLGRYRDAARGNPVLCLSLLAPLGARQRDACGH